MVHHDDGMGGANLPPPKGKILPRSAAEFIVETVRAAPGEITLVPLGPLTNIALALRIEPRIAEWTKRVVIMGGAATVRGNASPVAEANIHNDPDAAHIVFGAGWDLTMVGLDVTHDTVMSNEFLASLTAANTPAAELIGRVVPFYQAFFGKFGGFGNGIPTHDPSAIAYLIDPSLFRAERMLVWVETQGLCAGQTVGDVRRQWKHAPEVNVCLEVDDARLLDLFYARVAGGR